MKEEQKKVWSLSIGTYPGVLLGARTYNADNKTRHVLYLTFMDIALDVYK